MTVGRPTVILQSVAGIIRSCLRLGAAQVILARQKYEIPPDSSLLVVLSLEDMRAIANNVRTVDDPQLGMRDEQYLTIRDMIQIDVLAMTDPKTGMNQARDLRNQVLLALNSTYAEQAQEAVQYSLARIPVSFANTSSLEATQFLERYTATIAVTYSEAANQFPSYFDAFNAEFKVDNASTFTDAPPQDAFAATGG